MFCHRPASGCRAWRWTFRHKRSSTPGCRCLLIILYIVHKSFHSSSSSSSWSSLGFPSPFTLPPGVWLDRRQDWAGRRGGERGGGGGPQPHSEWGGGGEWGGTRRRRRRPWTRFATCAKVHISDILTVSNFLRTDPSVQKIYVRFDLDSSQNSNKIFSWKLLASQTNCKTICCNTRSYCTHSHIGGIHHVVLFFQAYLISFNFATPPHYLGL